MLSKIQVIIKDEKKQKIILFFLIIVFLLFAYLAAWEMGVFHTGTNKKNIKPVNTDINTAQSTSSPKVVEKGHNPTKSMNIAQIYPFVSEDMQLAQNTANNAAPPVIPTAQVRPNVGNIPLPAIPSNPAMNLQTSMPMPVPVAPNAVTSQKKVEVTGVFTGQDGQNMAIMSDGKIIKEGDSYNSNQISQISNNGIHFENGDSISYGVK